MKKKVLATLLVGAMAASLLAGCRTTVETTGSSDTTTAPEKLRQQRPQKQERQAVLMFRQTLPYGHIQSVNGAMQRQLIP